MYTKKTYIKVIIGFSICPFYVSGGFGIAFAISMLVDQGYKSFLVGLGISVFGFMLLPASFLLSLLYAAIKIRRNLWGVSFVTVMGGVGASLWMAYLSGNWASLLDFAEEDYLIPFLLGSVTSFFSGLFFLPEPTRKPKAYGN